jgi:hypothetical protein
MGTLHASKKKKGEKGRKKRTQLVKERKEDAARKDITC